MASFISVTIWGDVPTVYTTSRTLQLSCNHQRIGDYLITTDLQVLPLPGATLPVDETDNAGKIYPSKHYELTKFPENDGVKKVVLVKDNSTNSQYYVDKDSYDENIVNCNAAAYVTGCGAITGFEVGGLGVQWTAAVGVDGYEYSTFAAAVEPVPYPSSPGTFLPADTTTFASHTGAVGPQVNWAFLRTVCPGGILGDWFYINYPG